MTDLKHNHNLRTAEARREADKLGKPWHEKLLWPLPNPARTNAPTGSGRVAPRWATSHGRPWEIHKLAVQKLADQGWTEGPYDAEAKTHPWLVSYHRLPVTMRAFNRIAHTLTEPELP